MRRAVWRAAGNVRGHSLAGERPGHFARVAAARHGDLMLGLGLGLGSGPGLVFGFVLG